MSTKNSLTLHQNKPDFSPQTFEQVEKFASIVCKTNIVPREYKDKPHETLATIIFGNEIGLSPLQSLQNISNINGRTSIWGDALLALVISHPSCESVHEEKIGKKDDPDNMGYACTVKRKGQVPYTVTFTVKDAKKAGLWGKTGPWTTYPARMLQMRARGFALRDKFPDALRGIISREEAQDMPVVGEATTTYKPNYATAAQNFENEFFADESVVVEEIIDEDTGEILEPHGK